MLSISRIRENPDAVQQAIAAKGEQINLKNLLELDRQHRAIQTEVNDLRAERNRVSEKIAATKRSGGDDKEAIAAMRDVGDKIKALEEKSAGIDKEIQSALEIIPNIPHTSVPIGTHEKDNVVVKEWGDKPVFTYLVATKDSLGMTKDTMAAKPMVLYESDDLVALGSEEIAIRTLLPQEIDTYDPYEGEVKVWQI